ncbi:hypothetical protein IAU60_004027 [Kwoniella sp. DSM 27419]
MSLGVSPNGASPSIAHARPLPPNRKRNSYTPSPRATPQLSSSDIMTAGRAGSPVGSSSAQITRDSGGVMGGLREQSEEELSRATRENVEEALRKEWKGRERLMLQLEEADNDRRLLEIKHDEMVKAMLGVQVRMDEAFQEQSRMEADLEERDDLLERLRKKIGLVEQQVRDGHKKYQEQEKSFDQERQALQAQERHLQQRLKGITAIRQSASTSEAEDLASVKDELASANLSISSLAAKLNTVTKELQELKAVNRELVEENEGWEFLVRERTLSGNVKPASILGPKAAFGSDEGDLDDGPTESASFRPPQDDLEAEMDELHSDLEAQSPIFDDNASYFSPERDGSEATPDGLLAPPRSRRRGRSQRSASASSVAQATRSGLDLAAEMGMSEPADRGLVQDQGGMFINSKVSSPAHPSLALELEMKQLKEANKALTLYCSKIIDRIIAQEGFEHILSVDYKTRRGGSSRNVSAASRTALKDISSGQWGPKTDSPVDGEPPSIIEPQPVKERKARPLSMMVRAMTGPATPMQAAPEPTEAEAETEAAKEAKAEKRAKRGFSLDFRSLGFGAAPSEPKSGLKPLTLSRRASPSASTPPTVPTPLQVDLTARKLDIHDEDEEDRKERHRMEAALKLMGIERTGTPPIMEEDEFSIDDKTWPGRSGGSLGSNDNKRTTSASSKPTSRWSSFFGSREASPALPSDSEILGSIITEDEEPAQRGNEHTRGMSKSESIKTLWSMGGDSRPASGEVIIQKKE